VERGGIALGRILWGRIFGTGEKMVDALRVVLILNGGCCSRAGQCLCVVCFFVYKLVFEHWPTKKVLVLSMSRWQISIV